MILYTYFRSTAAYRVRIALNMKRIAYEKIELDLREGKHHHPNYLELNPQGLVPVLIDEKLAMSQSLAIIEYLEETHPSPHLLPKDIYERAWVRSFAQVIACDTHPLNNLRVLKYLESTGHDETQRTDWYFHWLELCFDTLEERLRTAPRKGKYCLGDKVTLADICLVPQIYNARRFEFDMSDYPLCVEKDERLREHDAFKNAHPDVK